ncbi:MutS-related protein [Prevotella pallens]|jgi:DNA mismatch repair protein mutS|uniref:MutS-related protein n=1 Tax=Prevotella pallens TaxID=60133 RepID=UPI001CAF8CCC|nr:DNA mismatch repair protein MutS [Prevotella pallens]MBF1450578.1 DNA mismatch repair protein MutS [Prevotella pallens]MBF1465990.1 DNA mismatch repair protein MutS [Prevotella pallens]MBF1478735.1 DNA mismatch repair protein MutS [Prevotella pallens]
MNKSLNELYKKQIVELTQTIYRLRTKSRVFVITEILSFAVSIAFVVMFTVLNNASWTLGVALCVLFLYFYIRNLDTKNDRDIADALALKLTYEKEIAYQEGDYTKFDTGERYLQPTHPFTFDLDIFGQGSLFQRINRTISSGGSDYLAECLAGKWETLSTTELLKNIKQRAEAIEELAKNEPFLSQFKAQGVEKTIDTTAIRKAFSSIHTLQIPSYFANRTFRTLIYANLTGFYLSIFLSIANFVPTFLPIWWGIFNFFLATLCCHKYIKLVNEVISKLKNQVHGYVNMATLIDKQSFTATHLCELKNNLSGAMESFGQLERILQKIDNRSNEIGIVLFNCFGLLDITIIRHFLRWQHTYEPITDQWIYASSTFDALVSMATFRLNEDKAQQATIVNSNKVSYKAHNIYHPFLGEKAVRNNFDIQNHEYYIITGANMAGKSTFLRTLGVNYILAMNGLPVFAEEMYVSVFRLFTNMRTTDDLTHGISYFNAELLRLKQLIASLDPNVPSLIILDEILKGTNSLDKLNGSRLFLEYISKRNVTGVIATHDLELSKLEDENPQRFHNYSFEIELGTNVTYTYKIGRGVAKNQNATFLLKQILA